MDQACKERILSEDYANFIIENKANLEKLLTHEDYCMVPINNIYSVLYLPISKLPTNLYQLYGYEVFPNCFGLQDIASLEASGVTKLRNIPKFDLEGQGILIGIIDTGIEYTHEAFRNADGSSRILSIWDQNIQDGTPPFSFNYGTEYKKEQLNQALQSEDPLSIVPSTDENGHGTMLAGTAAGSRSEDNNFSGVVPGAEIVVVKLRTAKRFIKNFFAIPESIECYEETDILMGLNYLLEVAKNYARPISICYGLGTFQGSHDERGVTSGYVSSIAEQIGVAIVIAGGNEGNNSHHYLGEIKRNNEFDTVEINVAAEEESFSMELWGFSPNTYSVDILSPTGEYIPRIPARLSESREIRFIFEKTIINVDYRIIEEQTGDPMIFFRFRDPTEGLWRIRVYASGQLNLKYHIWLPIRDFLKGNTVFIQPDPEYTLTSPGNTFLPIVVTTYNYQNGSLDVNAGKGFTRNNNISPSLAAPGVNMVVPALNNNYKIATGSSIAAAHTTGIAAMILEWGILKGNYPRMSSVDIKNILIRGATRDPNAAYPNKDWGYGILNIYNAFESLRSSTP